MKNVILAAIVAFAMTSCNSVPSYTIKGSVEKLEDGKALLLVQNEKKMDTLASAQITKGIFTLEGSVTEATQAFLVVEGSQIMANVILENEQFTAELSNKNLQDQKIIGGGQEQGVLNQFSLAAEDLMIAQNTLGGEYQAAVQAKDNAKAEEIRVKYMGLESGFRATSDSLIVANSNTIAAAIIAQQLSQGADLEVMEKTYNNLGEKAKASTIGKQMGETIKGLQAVAVGKVAPDFTLPTPDGKEISLHSIKAKVKVVDFWASWCGPCRQENPHMVKTYSKYKNKGLKVLGVSLDQDKSAWEKAIKDDKLTWLHVSDLKGWQSVVTPLYKINGIPHIIVLDENNVIVAKNLRGDDLDKKIAELLK